MAYKKYSNLSSSAAEYARILPGVEGGFRGMDLASPANRVKPCRVTDCVNMYRDYHTADGGALETVPGFRLLHRFTEQFGGDEIFGIHRCKVDGAEYLAVHAGARLYLCPEDEARNGGEWEKASGALAGAPSRSFVQNGTLYLLDGTHYCRLVDKDGDGNTRFYLEDGDCYAPTLRLNGAEYEQRNLLTDTFLTVEKGSALEEAVAGDVTGREYYLHEDATAAAPFYRYCGKSDFVYAAPDTHTRTFVGTKACMVVFDSKTHHAGVNAGPGGTNGEKDERIHSVALRANTARLTVSEGAFNDYGFVQYLYLLSYRDEDDRLYGFKLNGGVPMPSGGRVFCSFALAELGDALVGNVEGTLLESLLKLPPNVVVQQGGETALNDELKVEGHGVSFGVESNVFAVGSDLTDDSICIYTKEGHVHIAAGENVAAGEYVFYANIYDEYHHDNLRLYRVCVTEVGATAPKAVSYLFDYDGEPALYPLPTPATMLNGAQDGGIEVGFGAVYGSDGEIAYAGGVFRMGENDVTVRATATPYRFHVTGEAGEGVPGKEAVAGCTLCALYDGRVFLAGNPKLPNTVFYSQRNAEGINDPTYFGILNYFNDGFGTDRVTALLSFSDTLCCAKGDTLYFHAAADGDDMVTRVYPAVQGQPGIGCVGACRNFLDDPVLLTKDGVWGINKSDLTLERTMGRRSAMADPRLVLEKEPRNAAMVEWEGYLCLFINGNVYMADSRATWSDNAGGMQYEWYRMENVGVWRDADKNGLRYHVYAAVTGSLPVAGREVSFEGNIYPLTATHEDLYFTASEVRRVLVDGEYVDCALRDGRLYAVYETEEYERTGTFYPACYPLTVGDRLYFGTESGDLCVFNNDRRGWAPDGEKIPAGTLHRSCYSFAGCRMDSGFITVADDCELPHLRKSTSPRSMTVRAKAMDGGSYSVSVYTDSRPAYREVATLAPITFHGMDMSALTFESGQTLIQVTREHEKAWVEKQYLFSDGGFCKPFGIYSVSYRYRVAGRIK